MCGRPRGGSVALATILAFLILSIAFSIRAFAQQQAPETPASQREVNELRERINDLSDRIDFSLAVFGFVIVVGGGVSLYGFFKGESRTEEYFKIFKTGETAAQDRAAEIHEKFLIPSKETLELVNAALGISQEESDRRTKALEARAIETLRELDGQAKLLISRVPEEDAHELVSNPTRRAELQRLARRIDAFTNRLTFMETPQLTPHTLFIRGMDFHLGQNYEESVNAWEEVVVDERTPEKLESLAWYWIGREKNNLGKFAEAERSFTNARRNASGVMDLELQRNVLESRFFSQGPPRASALVEPFERLLKGMVPRSDADEASVSRVKVKVLTTLGNVLIEAGDECRDTQSERAQEYYEHALTLFREAEDQDNWALFGRAEALYLLGRHSEAYPIYKDLRHQAAYEHQRRVEPRAKTVARTLELVCCIRVPDLWKEVLTAKERLFEALDEVDENLTVYSEIWHRNVSKPRFLSQIDQLMREWDQLRSQFPAT